jgi:hypothetical protein
MFPRVGDLSAKREGITLRSRLQLQAQFVPADLREVHKAVKALRSHIDDASTVDIASSDGLADRFAVQQNIDLPALSRGAEHQIHPPGLEIQIQLPTS